MTPEGQKAIERRLEWFNREMDELWRRWHDPIDVAEHLAELLRSHPGLLSPPAAARPAPALRTRKRRASR